MKKFFLLLMLLFILCFTACGKDEDVSLPSDSSVVTEESSESASQPDLPEPSQPEESSEPEEILEAKPLTSAAVTLSMMEGVVYDKIDPELVLMRYRYVYPQLTAEGESSVLAEISKSYELEAISYMDTLQGAAADDASALYHAAPEYYQVPTYDCGIEVVYNENGRISLLQQQFVSYDGGGYPSTFYTARTYDLSTGALLSLEDLTGLPKEEACLAAAEEMKKIIDKDPEGFYVTAKDQLAYAIATGGEYYLIKKAYEETVVVVCLQETSIASYDKGAIMVELPAVWTE